MGDKLDSSVRRLRTSAQTGGLTGLLSEGEAKSINKKVTQTGEKPFRKGATSAKRDAAKQIAKQQQVETARLAEADSDVATKRAQAGSKKGRRSLLKSSPGGLAVNLGGSGG